MLAICDLGTVASSRIVVGFSRARADNADRLASVSANASSSVSAVWTDTAAPFYKSLRFFHISSDRVDVTVLFDQQHRFCVGRKPDLGVIFNDLQCRLIQKFECRRNDFSAMMAETDSAAASICS